MKKIHLFLFTLGLSNYVIIEIFFGIELLSGLGIFLLILLAVIGTIFYKALDEEEE